MSRSALFLLIAVLAVALRESTCMSVVQRNGMQPMESENEAEHASIDLWHNTPFGKTLIVCKPEPDDKLLFKKYVESGATILVKKRTTIVYPESGIDTAAIHCIRAIDISKSGTKGGTVTITQGGLNKTFVVLDVTSQRGRGYHFNIEIYGH